MRQWCRPNGSRRVCSVDRERFPLRSLSLHRLPQPATRSRLPVGEASSSPRRFRPAQEVYKSGALVLALRYAERVLLLSPKGRDNWLTALLWGEGQRAVRLIKHPWERCRRGGVAATWLMKAARSKRCRPARPLPGVGRLAERERPASFSGSSMQDQVALGAQRSPTPGKGGIARAAGSQERGSAAGEGWDTGSACLDSCACDRGGRLAPPPRR